jgi:stage II sporulation protein D
MNVGMIGRSLVAVAAFFCVAGLLPVAAWAGETLPRKIKVLILDDAKTVLPSRDEQLVKLGNMKGDLLMNGSHYTGNIEVWKGDKGLYVINEVPLEQYVERVVASEVGASWEPEALKAQAVISRTYAIYRMSRSESPLYHLSSSVLHQVYKGNAPGPEVTRAVRETAGEVLTYGDKPIEALYHSTAGVMTEDAEEVFGGSHPYLKPVQASCEQSPYWVWEKKIPLSELEKAVGVRGLRQMTVKTRTATGRVREVAFESEAGEKVIKATELRKLLGWSRLPSTDFTYTVNGDIVVFEGKGYGHGVGLCQWSALQMAKEGRTYREILSYFYTNTELRVYTYEGE